MAEIAFKRARGVVYRATTYDTCLWVSPNSRSGRWNDPQTGTISQYCTLDVASALAEMVRSENLRELEDARELLVSVWELRIDEGAVVDYSTPSLVEDQGFEWDCLVSDEWGACQAEARRLIAEGARGVVAPSAALPQGVTLTLFGPRTEIAWSVEPSLSIQIPARHIFRGAPGGGLVRDTRFFGEAYPDLTPRNAQSFFNFELDAERRAT
ncbi:MAG TPA: RES family NAD+ phosphorylase [Solirubrobacterales bacterium]|nr:RES family NAD+ phosphorylase [Solirubrobacterales bacterium]